MADAFRNEWAFVLAATIRVTGDIDVAEECVADAFSRALRAWSDSGVPRRPGAWLTTVARRAAIDSLRRESRRQRLLPELVVPSDGLLPENLETVVIEDDRLRLIFTCCHPALSPEAQVALSLKLLCGLTTSEIARAFLVSDTTMAARLTRAKQKIKTSRIPYRVPQPDDLPGRVEAVLTAIHLVFTTGHTAPGGAALVRDDLTERSLQLARMLRSLRPEDSEVMGLVALILLTDARRMTRTNSEGTLILLADQDRAQWDATAIEEGVALVRLSLRSGPPGRYALMAAIAAVHAEAPSWEVTDWSEIVALYDLLLEVWPTPVVALNRAVAVGFASGPDEGVRQLDCLNGEALLATYSYFWSSRADFLRQLSRREEARVDYQRALAASENEVERRFLRGRLAELR